MSQTTADYYIQRFREQNLEPGYRLLFPIVREAISDEELGKFVRIILAMGFTITKLTGDRTSDRSLYEFEIDNPKEGL